MGSAQIRQQDHDGLHHHMQLNRWAEVGSPCKKMDHADKYSVVATQGLGAAIITQIGGTPQFNQWFLYVLLVFVVITLVTEIIYLNVRPLHLPLSIQLTPYRKR